MAIRRYPTFDRLLDPATSPRRRRRMDPALPRIPYRFPRTGVRAWVPATDVSETAESFVLTMELPGVSREDVSISVEDNVLTVRGEKRLEREHEQRHRTERMHGTFERSFTLPRHVDADAVKAVMESGVLEIRLPRHEEAKAREIRIEGESERKEIEA
ncbi:MAG: Hsp20/alpha crystallin family protein [Gemmatimonadota bacterium]|nr:Hsp20/alpha crystallin family protein [Gemmatimonadota bacterium]